MNTLQWYLNGLVSIQPPNTFIGGVSASLGTPTLLASKLGILESRITNFSVVGSDIQCRITGSYVIILNNFLNNTSITYYLDNDSLVTSLGSSTFNGCVNLSLIKLYGVTSIGSYVFRNTKLTELYFPNLTSISLGAFDQMGNYYKLIYIQNCTNLGETIGDNGVFSSSLISKIYTHPSLATNNGGLPDGDLAYAITQGAIVRYVTNFTAPSHVTTLSSGTIYNTAIQLNFTPPTGSTNTIDFYECYANGILKNTITENGQYITGLTASTSYTITVIAVDIFYNKSVVSNSINATTTSVSWDIATGLVSYYKLDETTIGLAVDVFGRHDLINNGVPVNQIGKLGTSYLATVRGQKLETTSATPITGKFTMNCWVYRTAAPGTLGGIMQHGDYATNNGFGIWIWASGNLSWRINRIYNSADSATFAIPLNTWKMITMVYNQVNVKIYIDGILKVTTSHTVNPVTVSKRTLFYNLNNNSEFFGRIDEASFYNTDLNQTDIDILYNSGTGITL